jgi:hypothetical protein
MEIAYGFFCEHARDETAGKVTAIGMWGDLIRVRSAPPAAFAALAFFVYIRNPEQSPGPVHLRFSFPGIAEPVEVEMALTTSPRNLSNNVMMNFVNPVFTEAGTIRAEVSVGDQRRVFETSIVFEPDPPAPP